MTKLFFTKIVIICLSARECPEHLPRPRIFIFKKLVPLITYLKNDYMKDRHWDDVRKELNAPDLVIGEELKLQDVFKYKHSL